MVRLYLFCEGDTERAFARIVLQPHLAPLGIFIHDIPIANTIKTGKPTRGGGQNYAAMKRDILRIQRQESGPDVFFTTMIDLYAIAHDFPALAEADKLGHMPEERVRLLETAFAVEVPDRRFVPHIQLHEFETLLFADPRHFSLADATPEHIEELMAISRTPPEQIDGGQHTAPSKRIIAIVPGYENKKAVTGPLIAESIGLPAIRAKCPHFDAWVGKLETLRTLAPAPLV